jgi:hypothetical protein
MIPPIESLEELHRDIVVRDIKINNLSEHCMVAEREVKDLKGVVSQKNAQVVRLEAENVRLKMQRTDAELAGQVEGLRKEVGIKDRALVDYKRQLAIFIENEKLILARASAAEQKVATLQNTLTAMQVDRDTSERRAASASDVARESERLVAQAVVKAKDADERARVAVKPYENLLRLAEAVVLKSPSLNRNETEAKSFRTALELHRKSKGQSVGPG